MRKKNSMIIIVIALAFGMVSCSSTIKPEEINSPLINAKPEKKVSHSCQFSVYETPKTQQKNEPKIHKGIVL